MELLELKSVWNTVAKEVKSTDHLDEYKVASTIRKDSKTVLSKIKRVMYFKFIFGGFTLAVCVLMFIGTFIIPEKVNFLEAFFNITENRIFLLSIIIFISVLLNANYKPFIQIKKFNRSSGNVKTSLKRFIGILEKAIKLNIYSGAIFNSALSTWVFYAVAFKSEPFSWNPKGFIVALVPFVTFSLFYLWSRYEQKLKFGRYLNQLKTFLKEIEEE